MVWPERRGRVRDATCSFMLLPGSDPGPGCLPGCQGYRVSGAGSGAGGRVVGWSVSGHGVRSWLRPPLPSLMMPPAQTGRQGWTDGRVHWANTPSGEVVSAAANGDEAGLGRAPPPLSQDDRRRRPLLGLPALRRPRRATGGVGPSDQEHPPPPPTRCHRRLAGRGDETGMPPSRHQPPADGPGRRRRSRPGLTTKSPWPGSCTPSSERRSVRPSPSLPLRRRTLLETMLDHPDLGYDQLADRLSMPVGSIGPTRQRSLDDLRRHRDLWPGGSSAHSA